MSKAAICDICGEIILNPTRSDERDFVIKDRREEAVLGVITVDLCLRCYKPIQDYILKKRGDLPIVRTGEAAGVKSEDDDFKNYLFLFDTPEDVDTFFYKLKARFLQTEISHVENHPLNWHPERGPIVISTHKRAWYLDLGQLPDQRTNYERYHCKFALSRIMGNAMKDSDFWYGIIDDIVEREKEDP